MDDLISRKAAIQAIADMALGKCVADEETDDNETCEEKSAMFKAHQDSLMAIRHLPSVPAVRVVRCADCVCWEAPSRIEREDGSTVGHCRNHYGVCGNQQTDMAWFCADGVKTDGGEADDHR